MRRQLLALLLVTLAGSAVGFGKEKTSLTLEFSVAGMSCADCAQNATKVLKKIGGVRTVTIDFASQHAILTATREISREQVEEALGTFGFEARFPGDTIVQPLSEEEKAELDIATASHGEAFELAHHLAAGKITLFDYYADWCGPCHLLTPKLERLLLKYDDLALRTVDISTWESEAAQQANLPGLPYVRIYGPQGKLLGSVQGNQIQEVEEVIQRNTP
jgi:copper chaperone CopZ